MSTKLQLVPFYDGAIEGVLHDDRPWCAVRSICNGLGLHVDAQHKKLRMKLWATIRLIRTVAADGKDREVLCIDLDSLPMWLATLEPSRVRPEARAALVVYQKEAARVLRDHFLGRAPAAPLATVASQVAVTALEKEVMGLRRDLQRLVLPTPGPAGMTPAELRELLRATVAEALAVPRDPVSSEEMARILGVSLRRFQQIYRGHATLRQVAALELGTRGAGQELRWDADLVLRTLNRRPAAARTAGADPRALRLRELLTRMAARATGDAAAAYTAAAYQVANLFDLPTAKEQP